jgi:hypothetical protein
VRFADLVEVQIAVARGSDGEVVVDLLGGLEYCRISWPPRCGPPRCRGIYIWTTSDLRVLYVGKATSNDTSHLYRRITGYKKASPGKTQQTSLRLDRHILEHTRGGGQIRLFYLPMRAATPDEVTRTEEELIRVARPPWNRGGNLRPREERDALALSQLCAE